MSTTLFMNSGKRNSRTIRRQASERDVASIGSDDGGTRLEAEIRPDGGIYITVKRERLGLQNGTNLPDDQVTLIIPNFTHRLTEATFTPA